MNSPMPQGVRPHELFFGSYLLLTWCRLVVTAGFFYHHALVHLALILGAIGLIAWNERKPTNLSWQLRLWFYFIAMNVVFFTMKESIPLISNWRMDSFLQQVDSLYTGTNLSVRLEPFSHPVLTEILSACYLLFFPYLLFSIIYYSRRNLPQFRAFTVGLFAIYGIGFLGYSLMPAAGPYIALKDAFTSPLHGGPLTNFNTAVVSAGSNGVDVFPSLHCAVSCYFLFFDRQHTRWRFQLYLLPCIGLWLSTVYLRYHYVTDLVFGFALAAFGLWLAKHEESTTPQNSPTATT